MRLVILSAVVLCVAGNAAFAQNSQRPDRKTMQAVIQELGVQPQDMRACGQQMRATMPRPQQGQSPTDEQRAQGRAAMYDCLKSKNPNLTEATFESAMAKLPRPNG